MMRTASLIVLLLAALHSGMSSAEERKECAVCGMYIDLYERTTHVVYLDDGSSKEACSLACAAKLINENEGRIKKVLAADFLTGELINARDAFYLEGSDVPGVMSYTSRIAFSSLSDAEAFKREHGGRILPFDEALKHQMEE
jgi:nitrous oxide reductase accessory protein NosL